MIHFAVVHFRMVHLGVIHLRMIRHFASHLTISTLSHRAVHLLAILHHFALMLSMRAGLVTVR